MRSMLVLLLSAALITMAMASTSALAQTTPFAEQAGWITVSSEDGRYTARFPGKPIETQDTVPTDVGEVDLMMSLYEVSDDVAFFVTYGDYPASMVALAGDTKGLVEAARDGMVESLGGHIQSEQVVEQDGYKGKRIHATGADGVALDAVIYLVDNRLYQLIVVHRGSQRDPHVNKFFAAFDFTNP